MKTLLTFIALSMDPAIEGKVYWSGVEYYIHDGFTRTDLVIKDEIALKLVKAFVDSNDHAVWEKIKIRVKGKIEKKTVTIAHQRMIVTDLKVLIPKHVAVQIRDERLFVPTKKYLIFVDP